MKIVQSFLFILSICLSVSTSAKTLFIKYDAFCMDRYEYRYNGAGHGHIAYHVWINQREKVILEVGIESKILQPDMPANVKTCGRIPVSQRMTQDINNGDLQVYIVRSEGNGYNVSPVGIASYAQISPTFVGMTAVDHRFVYNFTQAAGDKDIATNNSDSKVFFKGVLDHECPRKLQFERTKLRAGKSFSEMIIIPEIGVIEEKTGFNPTDAENNRLVLSKVNDIPIQKYLDGYCKGKGVNYTYSGTFYTGRKFSNENRTASTNRRPGGSIYDLEGGNQPRTSVPKDNRPETTTTTTTTIETTFSCPIYKDIDKGLYFDRNTGALANTECGGNTYRNGLMVSDPGVVAGPTTTVVTGPTSPTTTTSVPTTTTVVTTGPCTEFSSDGVHVVQPNETLYGISRLYSISVDQLRELNSLRGNLIQPCMKLRTRRNATPLTASTSTESTEDFAARGGATHTVQANETLYQLAKRYGYTAERFRQMNNLGPNDLIYIGQQLKTSDCNCPSPNTADTRTAVTAPRDIPVAAEFAVARVQPESYEYTGGKRQVHIVKDNETIYSIARAYKLSVDRLRALNDLEENEIIIPYQRLYVN